MSNETKMPVLPASIKTWDEGIQAVRGRTSWFVTALALIAVAVFGATAIVVRPELSWEENWPQMVVAFVLGALGAAGAIFVSYAASKTYLPVTASLDKLPEALKKQLTDHPESYLPPGSTFQTYEAEAIAAREIVRRRRDELSIQSLKLAANPDDPNLKNAVARAELILNGALDRQRQYQEAFNTILERARCEAVAQERKLPKWVPVVAALVAFCGIGYQLALSTPKTEGASASSAGSGATVGVLVRDAANPSNTHLWETLGLEVCQPAQSISPAGILVAVSSGKGTPENPYAVTTLPETAAKPGCPAMSFSTIDAVAQVVLTKPAKVEITYKLNPSPSPS